MAGAETPEGLFAGVLRAAQRFVTPKAPRVVRVQMNSGLDVAQTTGVDPQAERRARAGAMERAFFSPAEQSRRGRYADYREIDQEVPELSRARHVFVDFVFGGEQGKAAMDATQDPESCFELTFGGRRQDLEAVVTGVTGDLDLHQTIRGIIAEGKWLGDSFTELLFGDSPYRMMGQAPHRPEDCRVEVDAYRQVGRYLVQPQGAGAGVSEPRPLHPFQAIHYAPGAPRGEHYGHSLWHSARKVWRHHETFDDLAVVLGVTRASGDEYWLWPFPADPKQPMIDDWINRVKQSVDFDVFFDAAGKLRRRVVAGLDRTPKILPYRAHEKLDTKPTVVETRPADLNQIVRVLEHYQDRFFIASGVPAALVGLERNVNAKATLEQQGLHFVRSVRQTQKDAARILVDIYTRALLVAGIVPQPGDYAIRMPDVSTFDAALQADVLVKRATAAATLVKAGAPVRFALRMSFGLSDDALDRIDESIALGADRGQVLDLAEDVARQEARDLRRPVAMDGAARLDAAENQPHGPGQRWRARGITEAAKPKPPEAPADAPFEEYAWASRREAMPDEPDNAAEDRVFAELKAHFASRKRRGLPKDTADMLRDFLAKGWYAPVIHAPPQETVYRGLRLYGAGTDQLKAILGGVDPDGEKGALDFPDGYVVPCKNGYSTSWSAKKKATAEFSTTGRAAGWRVTLLAKPGDPANEHRFLAGPGGLYDVDGLSKWHLEKESVGLEPVTVFRIEWEYLPYMSPSATNAEK